MTNPYRVATSVQVTHRRASRIETVALDVRAALLFGVVLFVLDVVLLLAHWRD